MSKAYAVLQFNLINPELFGNYIKVASSTLGAHGGKVIVASENSIPQEGSLSTSRTTIIEFPSRDAALNWYNSTDYDKIKHLRHEATSHGSFILLDESQRPNVKN